MEVTTIRTEKKRSWDFMYRFIKPLAMGLVRISPLIGLFVYGTLAAQFGLIGCFSAVTLLMIAAYKKQMNMNLFMAYMLVMGMFIGLYPGLYKDLFNLSVITLFNWFL